MIRDLIRRFRAHRSRTRIRECVRRRVRDIEPMPTTVDRQPSTQER